MAPYENIAGFLMITFASSLDPDEALFVGSDLDQTVLHSDDDNHKKIQSMHRGKKG